jgi:hypothetical protein
MAYNLDPGSVQAVRSKLEKNSVAGQASGNLDRQQADSVVQAVTAAVERYLAQRGAAPGGVPAPAPPSRPALHDVVAGVVDRYLEQRAPRPSAPACGCGLKPPATDAAAPPTPAAPKNVEPPAPPVTIVDFVCESDVRTAMARGRKIFIGPRTIVTPSARELAAPGEILVRAQR